jgi:hypothetical protein
LAAAASSAAKFVSEPARFQPKSCVVLEGRLETPLQRAWLGSPPMTRHVPKSPIWRTLRDNLNKIAQHGKRADSIVKICCCICAKGQANIGPST